MKKNSKVIKTFIGAKTVFDGDITAMESLRIDGTVKGNIKVEGQLVISKTAKIQGNVMADDIMIGGILFGNIHAKNKVEAFEKAQIYGDIQGRCLMMDEKVIFQGKCNLNEELSKGTKADGVMENNNTASEDKEETSEKKKYN